jgi:hypothetical protein
MCFQPQDTIRATRHITLYWKFVCECITWCSLPSRLSISSPLCSSLLRKLSHWHEQRERESDQRGDNSSAYNQLWDNAQPVDVLSNNLCWFVNKLCQRNCRKCRSCRVYRGNRNHSYNYVVFNYKIVLILSFEDLPTNILEPIGTPLYLSQMCKQHVTVCVVVSSVFWFDLDGFVLVWINYIWCW